MLVALSSVSGECRVIFLATMQETSGLRAVKMDGPTQFVIVYWRARAAGRWRRKRECVSTSL